MRYIDLTQTITANTPVYPGDPKPQLVERTNLENDGVFDYTLTTGMHVGTHIDAPAHLIPGGASLHEISLDRLVAPIVVVDARGKKEISLTDVQSVSCVPGTAVLICTGWAARFGDTEYYHAYPTISPSAATYLAEQQIGLVGLDCPSPDQPPFPVHKILLGHDVLIIENLCNLEQLVGVANAELLALPLKITADSAPARVVARIA